MADQHNDNIPALANQIAADIPDMKENFEFHKDVLQMLIGWHDSTIGSLSPPGPQRSKFRWKDGNEIYIGPGVYFHDGGTRQMVFWDAEITFVLESGGSNPGSWDYGGDGWHYIYLDNSAIVTQASPELDAGCFMNKTTAPTWSDSKHGWYHDSDRCIFAVYETGDAILEFWHDGGDLVLYAKQILNASGIDPDSTWTDVTLTIPAFTILAEVTMRLQYVDGDTTAYWKTNGQTGSDGHVIGVAKSTVPEHWSTFRVLTDSSQIIEVIYTGASGNLITVHADGWYFPTGI